MTSVYFTTSILLAVLTYSLSVSSFDLNEKAYIRPRRLFLEKGQYFHATCTLNKSRSGDISASEISFALRTNDKRIPLDRYANVVDSLSAELILPGRNVTLSLLRRKWLECRARNKTIAEGYLHVGLPPHRIKVIKATLRNWEELIIEWKKHKNTIYPTKCDVSLKTNKRRNIFELIAKDIGEANYVSYRFSNASEVDETKFFIVSIFCKNTVQNNTYEKVFYKDEIVQPLPITEGVVQSRSNSITLSWTPLTVLRPLTYRFIYRHGDTTKTIDASGLDNTYTIKDLQPFTRYHISVASRGTSATRWSTSVNMTGKTLRDVPGALPEVSLNGYRIVEEEGEKGKRKVLIYWKPIQPDRMNSDEVQYHVSAVLENHGNQKDLVKTSTNLPYASISLSNDYSYKVTVEGENQKGFNESLSPSAIPVVIPKESEALPTPENVTAFINGKNIEIRWTMEEDTQYTAYVSTHGNGNISWYLNATSPLLPDPGQNVHDYQYGVAASKNGKTSGITWSPCIYDISKASKVDKINLDAGVGEITINFPINICHPGYIFKYLIRYQYSDKTGPVKQALVPSYKRSWQLKPLDERATYTLNIYALTAATPLPKCLDVPISAPLSARFNITVRAIAGKWTTNMLLATFIPIGALMLLVMTCGCICCFRSSRNMCLKALAKLKVKIVHPTPVQPTNLQSGSSDEDLTSEVTQTSRVSSGRELPPIESHGQVSNSDGRPWMDNDEKSDYHYSEATLLPPLLMRDLSRQEDGDFPLERPEESSFSGDGRRPNARHELDSLSDTSVGLETDTSAGYAETKILPAGMTPTAADLVLRVLNPGLGSRREADGNSESSSNQNPSEDGSEGYRKDGVILADQGLGMLVTGDDIINKTSVPRQFSSPADIWSPEKLAMNLGASGDDSGISSNRLILSEESDGVESDSDMGYNKFQPILTLQV